MQQMLGSMFFTRIMVFEGRYSIQIDKIQHYVPFKSLRKRRLCDHQILAAHHACFFALSMAEGHEIFLKMSKSYLSNRYVRQRMGRNKLKSFEPLMCRMAMLAHIRRGSFFFKALGITLLFMVGFPDDLVQKETKYRNLHLLQKYYRTDEDAEGEELFLAHPLTCDETVRSPSQLYICIHFGSATLTKLSSVVLRAYTSI